MASRIWGKSTRRQLVGGGTTLGFVGITAYASSRRPPLRLDGVYATEAEKEFHTSSQFAVPSGYNGEVFQIKNDYPKNNAGDKTSVCPANTSRWPTFPAPGQGTPSVNEAPWLQKDFTNPKEAYEYCCLVKAYCWEGNVNNGFRIWKNKILLTDATDAEIPSLKGSPSLSAVIATEVDKDSPGSAKERNTSASSVRLTQVDFAVRDDRAPIGWVFGTFMYDSESKESDAWDRIIPVGLMWGNDPKLNQAAFELGKKPSESWINPRADAIRKSLGGSRPSWGWNGRMNGPADNFISSCASCHSVSQWPGKDSEGNNVGMVQPTPSYDKVANIWTPIDDKATMNWFRNIPPGKPFTPGNISGDYSLQLMIGMRNYQTWRDSQKSSLVKLFSGSTKYKFDSDESLRAGPVMDYTGVPPCNADGPINK